MLWMINSFSIKAINLLGFSATSHAGTIFPVSDTNSLGGDSAQLLSLKLWSVWEVFFCRRLHKTMVVWKGNAVRCSPRGTGAEKLSRWFISISSLMAARSRCLDKGREWKDAWAVFLRSILVTFGRWELSWLGISWIEGCTQRCFVFFFF